MMFYITCSILLLHIFLNYKYSNKNILACGLFAFSGKKDITDTEKKEIILKLKILGLYNQSRGENSCGISIDSYVNKGILNNAKWSDYIINNSINIPKEHNTIIGHTRKATTGSHNLENAHPFEIYKNSKDKTYNMIGAHNGIITNWKSMGVKYNINDNIEVDSKMLFTIINRNNDKTLNILKEYEGSAALLWYYTTEPNTLYVFKGESKKEFFNTYNNSITEEERPLFFLKTDIGIYISSLSTSLDAIKEKNEVISSFKTNKLFKITNGIIESTSFKVDRLKTNIKNTNNLIIYDNQELLLSNEEEIYDIKKKENKNKVYFWRGRYYKNGYILKNNKKINKVIRLKLDSDGNISNLGKEYIFWNGFLVIPEKIEELLEGVLNNKHLNKTHNDPKNNSILYNIEWLKNYTYGLLGNPSFGWGDFRYISLNNTNDSIYVSGWIAPLFSKYEYRFLNGTYKERRIISDSEIQYSSKILSFIKPEYRTFIIIKSMFAKKLDIINNYIEYIIVKNKDDNGNILTNGGLEYILHLSLPELKLLYTNLPDRLLTEESYKYLNNISIENDESIITIEEAIEVVNKMFNIDNFTDKTTEEIFEKTNHYFKYNFKINNNPHHIIVNDDKTIIHNDNLNKYLIYNKNDNKKNKCNKKHDNLSYFNENIIKNVLDELLITSVYSYEIQNIYYIDNNSIERVILKVNYSINNTKHNETITLCENEGLLSIVPITSLSNKNLNINKTNKILNIIYQNNDENDEFIKEENEDIDYYVSLYDEVIQNIDDTLDFFKNSEIYYYMKIENYINKLESMKKIEDEDILKNNINTY